MVTPVAWMMVTVMVMMTISISCHDYHDYDDYDGCCYDYDCCYYYHYRHYR